jgi:hypothetical protein
MQRPPISFEAFDQEKGVEKTVLLLQQLELKYGGMLPEDIIRQLDIP